MNKSNINIRGFFRIKLGEGNKVVADTGWRENTVTNEGLTNYIAASCGGVSGSKQFGFMEISSNTQTIAATATSLQASAVGGRKAISAVTTGTGTFRATAAWASSDSNITTSYTIGSVAMYDATATTATMGCAQTYATSAWATNQNLSATYELRFSTTT